MKCLLCHAVLNWQVTIRELISFRRLLPPKVCKTCLQQFHTIGTTNLCQGCGRERNSICHDCQLWQRDGQLLLSNRSLFHYNDAMKEFMHCYKFQGDYQLRQVFADQFTTLVQSQQADIIIPIPVTRHTMKTRGFNQVVGMLNCPCDQEVLVTKNERKKRQSEKGREQRLKSPQPFILKSSARVQGKRVLLVDDVYTTGRTLYHAATLCRNAGCASVRSITLAS